MEPVRVNEELCDANLTAVTEQARGAETPTETQRGGPGFSQITGGRVQGWPRPLGVMIAHGATLH